MLLLYPGPANWSNSSSHIYIPLCFYFIPSIRLPHISLLYLHSTMLLLYHPHWHQKLRPVNNLHSTMLLLYRSVSGSIPFCFRIYIPLCFYFIGMPGPVQRMQSGIYIPLCFYFISKYDRICIYCYNLHSTMLLLYLIPSMIPFTSLPIFTFHYASTLSFKCCPQIMQNCGFTFHYASTLSSSCIGKNRRIF